MKKHLVKLTVLMLSFTFLARLSNAQFYPVQVTPQLVPPYSVYLSDYATPGSEKLRVIVLQRDLTQPAYQLRLVMSVEWNGKVIMRTSRAFTPPPINIDPGIPTVISGADLAPYLDSRNIDFVGYSRDQYEKTRALPEGSYRIFFTAYDYRRQDVQVSNEGSSFYYLSKNEPPLINFPACGTKIPLKTPQQIVFSWLPRNTASPNSVAETEYEFALYETRPAGRNPNDVVLSTQPVFRTRTDIPQLIYGPAEPVLLENMKYVWRVQAIDKNGRDAFRNNGFSEVCTFTYGGVDPTFDIGVVKNLQAIGETERRGKISWEASNYDSYKVYYKKTGLPSGASAQGGTDYEWFSSDIKNTELKLFDLEPDTEYETRVQVRKSGVFGPYSEIVKFRTTPRRVLACGQDAGTLAQGDASKPLMAATRGMTIDVDGMEVMLLDVAPLGSGWYKGMGTVTTKLLGASFHVKFDRLFIDDSHVAGFGKIEFLTKGVAELVQQQIANQQRKNDQKQQADNREQWEGTDFQEKIFRYDNIVIADISFENGVMVITDTDGKTYENTEVPQMLIDAPEKAIIIEDKNGEQWVVQKDPATGETKVTKVEGGGLNPGSNAATTVQTDLIKNKIIVLILEQFEEEIAAWLRINGKGGEDDPDVMLALALPECFEKDADVLEYIKENTIPYYKEHAAELRSKIEADKAKKTLFDRIGALFNSKDDVDWKKVPEDDQEAGRDAICRVLSEIETMINVEALMVNMPDYFGQKIVRPNGKSDNTHEDAVLIQDEKDQTIAFILPDEKTFLWVDEGKWQGYFENGLKSQKASYLFYVEDKYMRKEQPISWGIYLAAKDLGGFAIDLVETPVETSKNLATGLYKIATLQFDIEKTWERVINADKTDGAYVVATLAMGYLAGPKGKADAPRFGEMVGEYASKLRPTKLSWPQLLALFKKARQFEALITTHLKTLYPIEQGFTVLKQVFVKVDGVMSIADNLIYNSKTGQFILNETKYGATNLLRKNQQIIQDAIKAGKQLEIRTAESLVVNGKTIFSQGSKIKVSKILRSNSIDGTISSNTVTTIWP